MKIGILADIHGDVENLKLAIERLKRENVDVFVALGDIIYDRRNASETVAALTDCGAIGVWGNHDLGLCVDPQEEVLRHFDDHVIDFFDKLTSHLEFDGVLFTHTLPIQDASDPMSFYLGKRPDEGDALDDCFSQFFHRIMLVGHFHRWYAATPEGRISWDGKQPIKLESDKRYFFVINAVMNGNAALLDDEQNVLKPILF